VLMIHQETARTDDSGETSDLQVRIQTVATGQTNTPNISQNPGGLKGGADKKDRPCAAGQGIATVVTSLITSKHSLLRRTGPDSVHQCHSGLRRVNKERTRTILQSDIRDSEELRDLHQTTKGLGAILVLGPRTEHYKYQRDPGTQMER